MEVFKKVVPISEAVRRGEGRVTVRGWVYRKRVLKEKIFLVLRDSTGILQLVLPRDRFKNAEELNLESSLVATGTLVKEPEGERLAELTMNKDVGVLGGISILGTTGIEFPVSDEEYLGHIETELKAVRAASKLAVLATGNRAVEYARGDFGDVVVKVGDWVGAAVKLAVEMGFDEVAVAGLPAKLVKVAAGALNTHHRYCDARMESLIYAAVAAEVPYDVLRKVVEAQSVAEALTYLGDYREAVLSVVASRVKERLSRHAGREVKVVIYSENGRIEARA